MPGHASAAARIAAPRSDDHAHRVVDGEHAGRDEGGELAEAVAGDHRHRQALRQGGEGQQRDEQRRELRLPGGAQPLGVGREEQLGEVLVERARGPVDELPARRRGPRRTRARALRALPGQHERDGHPGHSRDRVAPPTLAGVSDPDASPAADPGARLRTLSSGLLSLPERDLRPEALLVDDLGLDSLAAIEWGMAIEDEFGVSLPDDAWAVTRSYGAVEELLLRLLAARA